MATLGLDYFRSSIEELKRVSWPSRGRTTRLTLAVLLISLGAAAYLGTLDYFLLELSKLFIKR